MLWNIARQCNATRLLSSSSTRTILVGCGGRRDLSTSNFSQLIANVTPEKVAQDPELEAYIRANFPKALDPDYEPPEPPHRSKLNSFAITTVTKQDSAAATTTTTTAAAVTDDENLYPRNIRPLTTYLRDAEAESNSRRSRRLRYHRYIPGLVYGSDPTRGIYSHQGNAAKVFVKTQWNLLERELDRFRRAFEARVYELTVLHPDDDSIVTEPQLVVPANVQRHPVKEKLYCVNFLRYHPERPLKLPITYMNQEESPALKRDGYLLPIQRTVECFVQDGVDIPASIELECTGLQFRDVVRKDRLVLPQGVRLSDRVLKRGDEYIVAVVDGRSRGGDE